MKCEIHVVIRPSHHYVFLNHEILNLVLFDEVQQFVQILDLFSSKFFFTEISFFLEGGGGVKLGGENGW